jgi:hypothetical protein
MLGTKVGIAVCVASASALGAVFLGLMTVNVIHWSDRPQLSTLSVVAADVAMRPLTATLSASEGVIASNPSLGGPVSPDDEAGWVTHIPRRTRRS